MTLLPWAEGDRVDPFAALWGRHRRVALAIAATTRRRDARRTRAQLWLMLRQLACPVGVRPKHAWYVPGGVARQGALGIESLWPGFWDETAPSLRRIRAHLGALQSAGVLVRSPGDWIPTIGQREHRPRHPDTFHLIEDEVDATWWAEVGTPELEAHPAARHNPDVWWGLFRDWRALAAERARLSVVGRIIADRDDDRRRDARAAVRAEAAARRPADLAAAAGLEDAARRAQGPLELLSALDELGAGVRGAMQFKMAGREARLRGAMALLAIALRRGDTVTNRAGWLVTAFLRADPSELQAAMRCSSAARAGP